MNFAAGTDVAAEEAVGDVTSSPSGPKIFTEHRTYFVWVGRSNTISLTLKLSGAILGL
jgi:hypothetical protein